jgi:tail tube protein
MAKGFEGWVAVVPETNGWGSSAFTAGNYLYVDTESLQINKEFIERPEKITYGRSLKASSRISGVQKPGGALTFQPRSDDVIPTLMAHYQKYIGSSLGGTATGTVRYTFYPTKGEPNWVGSAFGTGAYTAADGDMFTCSVYKKFFNTTSNGGTNAMAFKSGIVDQLQFNLTAGQDAKMTSTWKFYDVDAGTALPATRDPNNSMFGSYSTRASFVSWSGTLLFDGGALDITSISINSQSNTEDRAVLGRRNPSKYPFGRCLVSGSLELDLPKSGLAYVGSMLNNSGFSITGSIYNSAFDNLTFSLGSCLYNPLEINFSGGQSETTFSIPFTAYESENGSTAPIVWQVHATGWGTVFNHI